MFDRTDDTIVAISSPPGIGLRGIVRLSGPDAVRLAAGVFEGPDGASLLDTPGHRRIMGAVRIDARACIPAEAYVFRAPASYTRQDIVELHTVGSPPVLAMLLDALTATGARPAEPGEFTARAFFAGVLDLTEVEGVAAMIHARNDSQLRASEALLHGDLSRRSIALRDELADLLALLEAEIDFVEESIEFINARQVIEILGRICGALDALLRDSPAIERLEALPRVMLVGRPNAGKSTLFNRLTGVDRAIQSATAGTTRDVLGAPLRVSGGEVILLDSAGMDIVDQQLQGREPTGEISPSAPVGRSPQPTGRESTFADPAALAEAATRRSLATADLILLVVDATDRPTEAVRSLRAALSGRPVIIVFNKVDACPPEAIEQDDSPEGIRVSALTGEGIAALRDRLGQLLFEQAESHGGELIALSNRQRMALREARDALREALDLFENTRKITDFSELLALHTREAMNALSLLTGEIATEELLGRIFSRFCIGK